MSRFVREREERQQELERLLRASEQRAEAQAFLDFSTAAGRLRDQNAVTGEFLRNNGSWYLVTLIAQNRDGEGNVTQLLVSARNIDEQKSRELEYQKNLREAAAEARRASQAKSNFLSRMPHDIRTPSTPSWVCSRSTRPTLTTRPSSA